MDESRIFRRGVISSEVKHGVLDVLGDGSETAPFLHFEITSVFTDAPFSKTSPHSEVAKVMIYGKEPVAAWHALPQVPKKGDLFQAKYAFGYLTVPQGQSNEMFFCIRVEHSSQFEVQFQQNESTTPVVEVPASEVLPGIMEKQLG